MFVYYHITEYPLILINEKLRLRNVLDSMIV